MRRYAKKKLVLSLIRSKNGYDFKQKSLFTLIPYPNHSIIHAVPYFMVGIICGPIWGSFPVRDHLRSNLEIICGPGSFAVPGSFAEPYRPLSSCY